MFYFWQWFTSVEHDSALLRKRKSLLSVVSVIQLLLHLSSYILLGVLVLSCLTFARRILLLASVPLFCRMLQYGSTFYPYL